MKRLIISLFTVLTLMVPARAQMQSGMWEIFPSFGNPTKLIDTPEYVYLLTNMSLVGFDKQTDELIAFNTGHRLNSNQVRGIWYSKEGKFLFVAHDNGMIDLLYDDGRTVNIADLTNTTVDVGTINDVDFREGKAYIATSRGIIVIDTNRGVIDQVGLFLPGPNNETFARIAVTDSKVIVALDITGRLLTADRKGNLSTYSSFNANNNYIYRTSSTSLGDMWGLEGDKFISVGSAANNQYLSITTVDPTKANNSCLSQPVKLSEETCHLNRLNPTKNGFVGSSGKSMVYVNNAGEVIATVPHKIASLNNSNVALGNWNPEKSETLWYCDVNGIGLRNNNGTFEVAQMRPAAISGTNIGQFMPTPDGDMYIGTLGYDMQKGQDIYQKSSTASVDIIKNNTISPATTIKKLFDIAVNPLNPDEIVFATWDGITRYNTRTKAKTNYTMKNSSLKNEALPTMMFVTSVLFDDEGNLWALQHVNLGTNQLLHLVTAADWANGAPQESWKPISLGDIPLWYGSRMNFIPNGPGYLVFSGKTMLGCIDLNGTRTNLSDDKMKVFEWSTDEDGMTLGGYQSLVMTPDKQGWVWLGYDAGVMAYRDLSKFFTSSPEPMRPKVSRNDGTNLADYLLNNVNVYDISVDANNHKWLATIGSGLYRVNEDGTEILDHFTKDTSDLPSDNVFAVYADPNSNKVYVGTDQGLAIYHALSSPAKRDFNDVYAFPNPVTPDYTGYITVTGLMNNSLVKITDSFGRVVHEGKSDGGSIVWDGCDATGSRVKSGVYFVYASQNSNGSSSAAVTKIVVVN